MSADRPTFVTGVSCATGHHLVNSLVSAREPKAITGLCRRNSCGDWITHVDLRIGDVTDLHLLSSILAESQPREIYHLAGSSKESHPQEMIETNVIGTLNLLQASEASCSESRILIVGSAAGFGEMRDGEVSLGPSRAAVPGSFYGISRETQLQVAAAASQKWGLHVCLCRTFNLLGPGLDLKYAPANLAQRMLLAVERKEPSFVVHNGDAVRDFLDIRDAVAAYRRIVTSGRPNFAYSVGSGIGVTIAELVNQLAMIVGFEGEIILEPGHGCPNRSGIRRSIADNSVLRDDTGWIPQISLKESLRDMITAMRQGPGDLASLNSSANSP